MRTIVLFLAVFIGMLLPFHSSASRDSLRVRRAVRNVIWFHPNRARVINGLALGPFHFQTFRDDPLLTVNGVNLELPGFALFPLPVRENYIHVNGLDLSPFRYAGTTHGLSAGIMSSAFASRGCTFALMSHIEGRSHGVHIAPLGISSADMRGIQIGGFNAAEHATGVTIGGYFCSSDTMRGFSLAGLNYTHRQRGVQLGIVNIARELRGVQVGLINYAPNCRRKVMPFIQIGRKGEKRG